MRIRPPLTALPKGCSVEKESNRYGMGIRGTRKKAKTLEAHGMPRLVRYSIFLSSASEDGSLALNNSAINEG